MDDGRRGSDGPLRIDGRSEFTAAVRHTLTHAWHHSERELCLVDPNFESWPLDDGQVLDTLAHWARLPQRRLILVACNFDDVVRRFARFTTWRGSFAHVIEAFVTEVEPSQVPSLLLAGRASLVLADRLRWRGHALSTDKEVADWREVVDVLLQRSERGFAANTLGL